MSRPTAPLGFLRVLTGLDELAEAARGIINVCPIDELTEQHAQQFDSLAEQIRQRRAVSARCSESNRVKHQRVS